MGCGASALAAPRPHAPNAVRHNAPDDGGVVAQHAQLDGTHAVAQPASSGASDGTGQASEAGPELVAVATHSQVDSVLNSRKWTALLEWSPWTDNDVFNLPQPALRSVLSASGRTLLGGFERAHDYQVAVFSAGTDWARGEAGGGGSGGAEGPAVVAAARSWLVDDLLGGDARTGLTHVFSEQAALRHVGGSVVVTGVQGAPDGSALLNSNAAVYLREALLEAGVVVLVLGPGWPDSATGNAEIEGLIKRRAALTEPRRPVLVVLDASPTDAPSGDAAARTAAQAAAALRQLAGRTFEVHWLSTHEPQVRRSLVDLVRRHTTVHETAHGEFSDLAHTSVAWPNWQSFAAMDGTNGWHPLVEVKECDWAGGVDEDARCARRVFHCRAPSVPSRRFRLRITRLAANSSGVVQLRGWEMFDAATGQNIVRPGNGYIRAAGESGPAAAAMADVAGASWRHECGANGFTWLEWLVPDDQAPVAVSHMRLSQAQPLGPGPWSDARSPVDFALECLPADVWPLHGAEFVGGYEQPATAAAVARREVGDQAPRWVALDEVSGAHLSDYGWVKAVPAERPSPACTAFRLRIVAVKRPAEATAVTLSGLRLQVTPLDEMRPLSGGTCSGSGGDVGGERCGPGAAFDGLAASRWVDAVGGGVGNTATFEYEHAEGEVLVEAYGITSQGEMYGMSEGLYGSPRDWVLATWEADAKAEAAGQPGAGRWVALDRRSGEVFSGPRHTRRFAVQSPCAGSRFRLTITGVRCGLASPSLQVGDIELRVHAEAGCTELLQAHHVMLHPSSSVSDLTEVAWMEGDPTRLQLALPIHPSARPAAAPSPPSSAGAADTGAPPPAARPPLMTLGGGVLSWHGPGVGSWQDGALQGPLRCMEEADGDVLRYGSAAPVVASRTDECRTEPAGGGGEPPTVWAELAFEEEVVAAGYVLRGAYGAAAAAAAGASSSSSNGGPLEAPEARGEPRSWRLEVWRPAGHGGGGGGGSRPTSSQAGSRPVSSATSSRGATTGGGRWEVVHEVADTRPDTHASAGVFYLPAPAPPAFRFRVVFRAWRAPCPLAYVRSLALLGLRSGALARPSSISIRMGSNLPKTPENTAGGGAHGGGPHRSSGSGVVLVSAGPSVSAAAVLDLPLRFRELASVDLLLRKRQGAVRLSSYMLMAAQGLGPGTPTGWVLEGLTCEY